MREREREGGREREGEREREREGGQRECVQETSLEFFSAAEPDNNLGADSASCSHWLLAPMS